MREASKVPNFTAATRKRRNGVPFEILHDRLQWLAQAYAYERDPIRTPDADHELLVTGLRADDPVRWDVGVAAAEIARDPKDGTPFVILTFAKPERRRTADEPGVSRWAFDPAAAFVIQAHVFCGTGIGLKYAVGSAGGLYFYPRLHIPNFGRCWVQRLIIDAPIARLAKLDGDDFHSLRRRNLGRTISHAQAARQYGKGQRRPRIRRADVIDASLAAWRETCGLTLQEYREVMESGYQLLDRLPLKFNERE